MDNQPTPARAAKQTAPISGTNIIPFPMPALKLRADVPPFNANNAKHIAAWENIWDCGLVFTRQGD